MDDLLTDSASTGTSVVMAVACPIAAITTLHEKTVTRAMTVSSCFLDIEPSLINHPDTLLVSGAETLARSRAIMERAQLDTPRDQAIAEQYPRWWKEHTGIVPTV